MSIGTIVSDASIQVQYLSGGRIGTVEESFIARLTQGDHFLFGGRMLEFVRVHEMTAFVKRATGSRGRGAALEGRQDAAVVRTGGRRARAAAPGRRGPLSIGPEMQAIRPLLEIQQRWSALPTIDTLVRRDA